jgi:hypothetical protein
LVTTGGDYMCPSHKCLLTFGKVAGNMIFVEKEFKLVSHKYKDYKGLCFYNGDFVLVVDV